MPVEESISLEETNKIRIKLGLKPLTDDSTPANDKDKEAEENYKKQREQEAKEKEKKCVFGIGYLRCGINVLILQGSSRPDSKVSTRFSRLSSRTSMSFPGAQTHKSSYAHASLRELGSRTGKSSTRSSRARHSGMLIQRSRIPRNGSSGARRKRRSLRGSCRRSSALTGRLRRNTLKVRSFLYARVGMWTNLIRRGPCRVEG